MNEFADSDEQVDGDLETEEEEEDSEEPEEEAEQIDVTHIPIPYTVVCCSPFLVLFVGSVRWEALTSQAALTRVLILSNIACFSV